MRSIIAVAALAMLLVTAIPPARADNDSMKVLVLVENRDYSVGSPVELTVWIYDGGVPADPDSTPEVTILSAAPRSVSVFKFGNGLFKGNFTIQAGDVVGSLVPVEASATIGKSTPSDNIYDRDTDIASIYLAPAGPALSVKLFATGATDGVVRPGARVTLAAEVASSGSPAQPDGFELTASYEDLQGGSHSEPVNSTSPRTGRFEAAYMLPQVPYDLHLTFTARATASGASASAGLSMDFNQFWVVCHAYTRSATSTTFYLYAGDQSGKAMAGAVFDIGYWPDGNTTQKKTATSAPSDTGGKSRFSLEFQAGTRMLMVEGTANASGKSQRFFGVINVSSADSTGQASTGGFEMKYIGPGDLYTPGRPAQRQYAAFNNSAPLRNSELYTYIIAYPFSAQNPGAFTPVEKVQARPYTTDAQGLLTIPFTPPSYNCTLVFYFKNATAEHPKPSGYFFNHDSNDGQYYSETADAAVVRQVYSGANVKVQAKLYTPGQSAPVKASLSGVQGGTAAAAVIIGDFDPAFPAGSPGKEWQAWAGLATYLNKSADGFSGSVVVPAFLPSDVKYSVAVFIAGPDGALPEYGSATLVRSAPIPDGGDEFPMQYMYLVIVVAAVVAGAAGAMAWRRRRARAAVPAGVAKTITCPQCGTPFQALQGPQPVKIQCPNCGKAGTLPPLTVAPAGAPAQPAQAAQAPAAPAAAPTPAGGVKVPVTCPQCGTVFDIFRGPGPTRIQCPKCGKSGTLAGLPAAQAPAAAPAPAPAQAAQPAPVQAAPAPTADAAMQAQMAAAGPAGNMMAQPATDMPRPEPVVQTRTISCPQCRNRFTIEKKEGPQEIRCPHCGKTGVIGRAPAAPAAPAPAPAQPAPMPQPRMMPAAQAAHQSASPYGAPMRAPQPAMAPAQQAGGRLITCPQCRNRFPVSDPRRPIKIKCPACGKEGMLTR
jgi:ribosomal protein S27E